MTANRQRTENDFLLEKRLSQTDINLHKCFRNSVFAIDLLLTGYKNIFPYFTDHTFEHSEQVIKYCNIIAGKDIVSSLNSDEIYILLMGASLHDIGMGISESDYNKMAENIPGLYEYIESHPDTSISECTRSFHQEFSAQFIKKYKALFEIPSDEYVFCIAQIARGHRNADLLDKNEYPVDLCLSNGKTVNMAYIAALVKLADELDITSDRNLLFDYKKIDSKWSAKQTMCYKCHAAIKCLGESDDSLILYYDTDEADVEAEILHTRSKVECTFGEYREVTEKRTSFENRIKKIVFKKIKH